MNIKLDERFFYYSVLVTLIVYVTAYTIFNFSYLEFFIDDPLILLSDILQPALCFFAIIAMLLLRHKTLRNILIITCLIVCIESLFDAYMTLVDYAELMEYSVINFIQGSLMLFIGVFLIISLVIFIGRLSSNTTIMFFCMLGMLLLNIISLLAPFRFNLGIEYLVQLYATTIPMVVLLTLMMLMMRSKSIRAETMLYSIRMSFDDIKDSGVPIGVTILRSDLKTIQEAAEREEWYQDYRFLMKSSYPNEYKAEFVKRDGRIFVTLSSLKDSSAIDGHRMILRGIVTDTGDIENCDTVRFYGEDGFFFQLIVVDEFKEEDTIPKIFRWKHVDTTEIEASEEI